MSPPITVLAVFGVLSVWTPLHAANDGQVPAAGSVLLGETLQAAPIIESLDIESSALAKAQVLTISAQNADLPSSDVWRPLSIGDLALSITTVVGLEEVLLSASFGADDFPTTISAGGEIQIEAAFQPEDKLISIFVNGTELGSAPYAGVHVEGLKTGPVHVELVGAGNKEGNGIRSESDQAAGSQRRTLRNLLLPNGHLQVLNDGKLTSRQQLLDRALANLGDAADVLLTEVVYLDWETGDDGLDGLAAVQTKNTRSGPKKTWAGAKALLRPGSTLIVNGNNGIYTDESPYAGLPEGVTILTLGDALVGTPETVAGLFSSGRWKMTPGGPAEVSAAVK